MTSDKKRILLQIGVFLLISFGLMYAFGWKTYAVILGGGKVSGWYNLCYYIAAFSPAIGCIAVRYIFHEGFKDDILFPKGGFTMNLGQKIKQLRIEKGWSQEQLASLLGYKSRSSVNKIELGLTDLNQSKIFAIANIFD